MKANIAYWRSCLEEAETELEAAKTRAAMDAAGAKLMVAKMKLKALMARKIGATAPQSRTTAR